MNNNDLVSRSGAAGIAATEETKAIAEVQAKMILARNFPRDVDRCMRMIELECQSKELAEKATYEFPRGDSVVMVPSIRLVECVARHWGNILCGVKEISSNRQEVTVQSYCWDLETNFADEKTFAVPYVRTTKKGGTFTLTDERDKYEHLANMAARRKRACIQAVIPKYIIDKAVESCQKTLEQAMKGEDIETVKQKMLAAFKAKAEWITEADFEVVVGKEWQYISTKDIVKLRNLYNAVADGFVKPEVAFKKEAEQPNADEKAADTLDNVNSLLNNES